MSATEYRAQFDAVVTFSNGGGLRAGGFRVDASEGRWIGGWGFRFVREDSGML